MRAPRRPWVVLAGVTVGVYACGGHGSPAATGTSASSSSSGAGGAGGASSSGTTASSSSTSSSAGTGGTGGACQPGLPKPGGDPCPARRVLTWGYDGLASLTDGTDQTNGDTNAASIAHVNEWLTFAEGSYKAQKDCTGSGGVCQPVLYVDPSLLYIPSPTATPNPTSACSDPPDTAFYGDTSFAESWLLHAPSAPTPLTSSTRLFHFFTTKEFCGSTEPAVVLYQNRATPGVQAFYKALIANWPGFWMMHDDLTLTAKGLFANAGVSAAAEVPDEAAFTAMAASFVDAMAPTTVVANALQTYNGPVGTDTQALGVYADPRPLLAAQNAKNAWGFVDEDPLLPNSLPPPALIFFRSLNTQSILLGATPPIAHVLLDTNDGTPDRRVHRALFWLGYKEGYSVDWSDFQTSKTTLPVYPESILVPSQPVQTMKPISIAPTDKVVANASGCTATGLDASFTGGARDLVVACGTTKYGSAVPSGVYRREFARCYRFGQPFGACAVIFNDTDQARAVDPAWLTQTYGHAIAWSASDVLTAGCDTSGCPISAVDVAAAPFSIAGAMIAAHDALFLAP